MDRSVNILDKIGSLIPGYTGYAERNSRRQCDKLLREKIAGIINSSEKLMSKRIASSIKANENTHLNEYEECRKKLNTIGDKIKFAPYGESAFFSSSQLKENELFAIYQKDLALLDNSIEINQLIPNSDCKTILNTIDIFETMVNERNGFIKEFK
jgi:hypothetical protein